MQYWIVKSGTKEVISGPFETQDEANKEMARFPVGGDAKSVTQGYYLGNGLLETAYEGETKDAIVSLKSKGLLNKSSKEMREYLEYEGFSKQAVNDAISWAAAKFESASFEKDMDENKPVIVRGVKGMKSTPFTKKFKNMAAYEKWADSEAAENFEVQQVMNESAVFDFSTTNDADILKVSAALEKAGIPFEVEEKGESFVVKVLDSRDQLVASELIGDTMKESSGFSEDYSNVVSQYKYRNKSATVFKKGDGFEIVFYRDGGLLSRDFYKTKEEAQSEAKAWVAGGVNESTPKVRTNKYSWGTMKVIEVGADFSIPLHPENIEQFKNLDAGEVVNFVDETGTKWKVQKEGDMLQFSSVSGEQVSVPQSKLIESAQLSPFERAGLNPVYSEDGKKATIKIFSECEMEKFNKVVEAYLNTYIESIEYKIEESDDNCLYVIEVKLVQSPETKGDPETMMKELKTE